MSLPPKTRFEIKMLAPVLDLPQIRTWVGIHPDGFHTAYPPRRVNNIYFDSTDLASYAENLAGIARRFRKCKRKRLYAGDGYMSLSTVKRVLSSWRKDNSYRIFCF